MLYDKQATTIDDEIALLKKRGMGGDEPLMRRWLETVGYYRLSAYWLPVELPAGEGQTRFDGICARLVQIDGSAWCSIDFWPFYLPIGRSRR
jgi:abortive infection bacteriophage resistance protein